MFDWQWAIVVFFWVAIFLTLSITHIKKVKVGGGLHTMYTCTISKEKMILRIASVLYLTIGVLLFHKYSYPIFDEMGGATSYYFVFTGLMLFIIATAVYIASRIALGSNWDWSGNIVRDRRKLITATPYNSIRHPQYTSFVLAGIASGLVITDSRIILFVLFTLPLIFWRAYVEEQHLGMIFPEYKDYKKKTRMFF